MENNAITDAQVTASSIYNSYYAAHLGRLRNNICWAAASNDANQWLQVDLRSYYIKVTRVATQGRDNADQWVTMYNLQYSDDDVEYPYFREKGQSVAKVK